MCRLTLHISINIGLYKHFISGLILRCSFIIVRYIIVNTFPFLSHPFVLSSFPWNHSSGSVVNPLQYSFLENPMDRGAWWAAVHRVAQSQTRMKWLSMHACIGEGNGNPLQCSCLENPGTEEPGRLPSVGSHRVGHDWSDLAAAAVFSKHVPRLALLCSLPLPCLSM